MVFGLICPTNNTKVSVCVWICCCKYILTFFDYVFTLFLMLTTQLSWFLFSRKSVLSCQQFSTNTINLNMLIREPIHHQPYLKTTRSRPSKQSGRRFVDAHLIFLFCKVFVFRNSKCTFLYFRLYCFVMYIYTPTRRFQVMLEFLNCYYLGNYF